MMSKFRKRPVVIDAERITEDYTPEDVERDDIKIEGEPRCYYVQTPEGVMRARVGDWIITGVEGEKYPCKPSVFEKTYEPLTQPQMSKRRFKIHAHLSLDHVFYKDSTYLGIFIGPSPPRWIIRVPWWFAWIWIKMGLR